MKTLKQYWQAIYDMKAPNWLVRRIMRKLARDTTKLAGSYRAFGMTDVAADLSEIAEEVGEMANSYGRELSPDATRNVKRSGT